MRFLSAMVVGLAILISIETSFADEFKNLLEKDSLQGWISHKEGEWTIKDGLLYGTKKKEIPYHCILFTEKSYGDFVLKLEYQSLKGNSGFFFRTNPKPDGSGFQGYQAEIDSKSKNAGGIFDVEVNWLVKPDPKLAKKIDKPGEWNTMTITAKGKKISVHVNGTLMTEATNDRSAKGQFGIQLHANENTQVKLKNIRIKEL